MRKYGWIKNEFHCRCGKIIAPNLRGVIPFAIVTEHIKTCQPHKTAQDVEKFMEGYIDAMLWSSTDDDDTPLSNYLSASDISDSAMQQILDDCTKFWISNMQEIPCVPAQAGHDFWLTRQGHGAGFWDGDWPEHGDKLTEASRAFSELSVSVEDGKIYLE